MPRTGVNGIEIYYEISGPENAPVLVLSNGIMMSTASWEYQNLGLNPHLRVLRYDCRGMWKSDHPEQAYSMAQHADDLAGLLDALHIEKAHIAGISYGAEISMVFALNFPDRTKSLIVINGVSEVQPLLKAQTYPWLLAAERDDAELLLRSSYHMNFGQSWIEVNQAFIESSVQRYAEMEMLAFTRLMAAFYKLEITKQLSDITAPTLIITGEEDIIKGRKYAKIIADQVQGSEWVIIPGSGHAVCLEKPAILNTLLLGFVIKNE